MRNPIMLCVVLSSFGALWAGEDPTPPWTPGTDDPMVGPLDEGKAYRTVDGQPILGKEVGDFLTEERWDGELSAFAERILVQEAVEQHSLTIAEGEVDAEVERLGRVYAKNLGLDPRLFTIEELAKRERTSMKFLRDQTRTTLGLKALLVKEGVLKAQESIDSTQAKKAMQERLDALVKEKGVTSVPKKPGENAAVRISGRTFGREQVRAFILERMGSLRRSDVLRSLEVLTYERAVDRALAAIKKEELTEQDRITHLSYLARLMEYEQGAPNGQDALMFQIQQKGWEWKRYIHDRGFTFDAKITILARQRVSMKDTRAEFEANKPLFARQEMRVAHIFIRVRDPQGMPYNPHWQAEGHPKVNDFVAQEREEQFRKSKDKIDALVGVAGANFAEAAYKQSEDEDTKKSGGMLAERIGPRLNPPPPFDEDLVKAALKLKPGEISAPLRSGYGWHIVKCLEKEKQETVFEDEPRVQEHVYVTLIKRKRAEISKELIQKAVIEDVFERR